MNVLIVDDEPAARRKLARFLADSDGVHVVGEAKNGREAVDAITERRPDLVFLDIQMPDMTGFDVIDAIAESPQIPAIVFVTAYDQYAVRAFEVSAVDYLLKPYDRERFETALNRARKTATQTAPSSLWNVLEALRPADRYARRLLVTQDGRSRFVGTAEIVRCEADRNYAVVHTRSGEYTLRTTLDALEQKLDPQQFVRIHRSHLVNIDAIGVIHPWFHGDYKIALKDGAELMWSRRYAARRPDLLAAR